MNSFNKILFLDIETVPLKENFEDLSDNMKLLWEKKFYKINKEDNISVKEGWSKFAGIYSEFAKIVCISTGFIHKNQLSNDYSFRTKSFYGDKERELLIDFKDTLKKYYHKPDDFLCAHNGKEFDYPFIGRRLIINEIEIPDILNLQGKKPWEVKLFDTMEMWKFGDYKNYTSLELLAEVLNIPTPKDDMNGSEVSEYYYKKKDLESIVKYCEKDIITTAKIFMKLKGFYKFELSK